jgi:ankyrin repeat protein
MSDNKSHLHDSNQVALWALVRAIASRAREEAKRLLSASPALATEALKIGATREEASTYYFEEIGHYAYGGDTALHMAAAAYELDLARELVSRGGSVNARNRRGAEPLHYASDGIPGSSGWNPEAQFAIVDFLIKVGADPNSVDGSGVAPLHRAVRTRCASAVHALLLNGADVRRKNRSGSTPLHLAVQTTGRGGSGSTLAREQQAKIIQLLLENGARSSDKDEKGKTVKASVSAAWIHELFSG